MVSVVMTKYLFSSTCLQRGNLEQSTEQTISQKTFLYLFTTSLHLDGDTRGESGNVSNSAGLIQGFEQGVTRRIPATQQRTSPSSYWSILRLAPSFQPDQVFKGDRVKLFKL